MIEKNQMIEHNTNIPPKLLSGLIKKVYAKGLGSTSYAGTIYIQTESDLIALSWHKSGRAVLNMYRNEDVPDSYLFEAVEIIGEDLKVKQLENTESFPIIYDRKEKKKTKKKVVKPVSQPVTEIKKRGRPKKVK
jgi:hypothetical protein